MQSGALGDGKVWNSCCGEGDGESAGAKYQTAPVGLRLEGTEGAAVFYELTLRCSGSLHLLSAAGRQKQEAGSGMSQG